MRKFNKHNASSSARFINLVLPKAIEVFGSETQAWQWLESPNAVLSQRRPIGCLQTSEGREQVLDMLVRIEHGIFS